MASVWEHILYSCSLVAGSPVSCRLVSSFGDYKNILGNRPYSCRCPSWIVNKSLIYEGPTSFIQVKVNRVDSLWLELCSHVFDARDRSGWHVVYMTYFVYAIVPWICYNLVIRQTISYHKHSLILEISKEEVDIWKLVDELKKHCIIVLLINNLLFFNPCFIYTIDHPDKGNNALHWVLNRSRAL